MPKKDNNSVKDIEGSLDIFENLPLLAYNISLDGKIINCNNLVIDTLGYKSKKELIGKPLLTTVYAPSSRTKAKELLLKWKKTGKLENEELQIITKKGKLIDILLNVSIIYDTKRKPLYSLSTQLDITGRKKAEEGIKESERTYKTLVENIPQKIFLKDKNCVYISCNENYAKDLKIKPEEIVGKTDFNFYPKKLAEKYRADDKRIMEADKTEDIEEEYIRDGEKRFVHTIKTAVKDEKGDVGGIFGIFWDITEQKKSEAALKESEEKFRNIFDSSLDAFILVDGKDKMIDINNSMLKILGYSKESLIGRNILTLHLKEDHNKCKKNLSLASSGKSAVCDCPYLDSKKRLILADTFLSLIILKGKKHILISFRDVTERKKAEEQVKEKIEEWDRTFDSISDFVFILDENFAITQVNEAFADLIKSKPEDIIGKKCYELIHKSSKPWPKCPVQLTKRDKKPHTEEVDDSNIGIPLLITTSAILDKQGKIEGYLHIAKDISDSRKAEESLKKRIEELESFHKLTVGRELKMIELKKRIEELEGKLGNK